MQEQRELHSRAHQFENLIHLRVACKQTKGPPLCESQQPGDFLRRLWDERRIAHIREPRGNVQQGLPGIVEFVRQHHFSSNLQSQPLLQKIKAAAHGQRRGGHYDGVEGVEEMLAQDGADVDRRSDHKYPLASPVEPIHIIFFI